MSDGETRVDGRKKKMERRNVRQMERKLSQSNGIFHRICLKSDVSSDADLDLNTFKIPGNMPWVSELSTSCPRGERYRDKSEEIKGEDILSRSQKPKQEP